MNPAKTARIARRLRDQNRRLRRLVRVLAERVAKQSELLRRRAEK